VRVVGIDLGQRRIGIAVTDSSGTIASPRATLRRSGNDEADRHQLVALVEEVGAGKVVVGLPLSMNGREGKAALLARQEIAELEKLLAPRGVSVESFDERLTTVTADRALSEAGLSGQKRRRVVDQSAAAVMLQAWLEQHRGG